jgi:uncharacterized protein YndB with AHSA1/START domain
MNQKNDATAADQYSVVHGMFKIERKYPVPPARVFFAFADKATKRRWWVEGEGWDVFDFTSDFRVGGSDMSRYSFRGGPEIRSDTQFQDIVPDRRIVFSYRMTVGPKPLSVSLVTVELFPSGAGTLMTFTEQGAYFDGVDSVQGREEGTRQGLERLADELQNSK